MTALGRIMALSAVAALARRLKLLLPGQAEEQHDGTLTVGRSIAEPLANAMQLPAIKAFFPKL